MSEPYIGQVTMVGFNFAPVGWALCNGQLLAISEYSALFNIIGTTYGGDGVTTFALPNLQGRVPLHQGSGITIGEAAGESTHTLLVSEIPSHIHPIGESRESANLESPANALVAAAPITAPVSPNTSLAPAAIQPSGGSQPHENMQPYLTINFIIALEGIYPQPSQS